MYEIISNSGLFIIGALLLVWAADKFVMAAAALANYTNKSKILIGTTIVAVGTSAPELFISIMAATSGAPRLAIGDAVGSNIANIGLVTGVMILCKPSILSHPVSKQMLALLISGTIAACSMLASGYLSPMDGAILALLFVIALFLLKFNTSAKDADVLGADLVLPQQSKGLACTIFWLIVGLILLPISAQLTVTGSTGLARLFGISEYVIGLFLVAIGTSLPELATVIVSVIKNENDIALGNIIGSNIFNLTLVLAPVAILAPTSLPSTFVSFDLPFLFGFTALFTLIISHQTASPTRVKGVVLLLCYLLYLVATLLNPANNH